MPGVNVYLPLEDLLALKAEGEKRKKSRSALLKERIEHKCPPVKPSRWPDNHKCPKSVEEHYQEILAKFGTDEWSQEFKFHGKPYRMTGRIVRLAGTAK